MESYIPLAPVASMSGSTSAIPAPPEISPRDNNDTTTKSYHTIEQGEMEFQGYSADRTFIQELKEKLGDWPGGDTTRSQLPPSLSVPGLFDHDDRLSVEATLPTKDWATKLVETPLDAQILLQIIHRPSFDASFSLIYSLDRSEYSMREVKFLPLLYAVLAYGCLFIESESDSPGDNEMLSQGYFSIKCINVCFLADHSHSDRAKYYAKSRQLQDIVNCRDLAACCGMPRLLSDEEVDQELPKEVNDVYIGGRRISMQPPSEICYMSGANAYNQLHFIRDKVTRQIYPVKGLGAQTSDLMAYAVNLETVHQIERELNGWVN